MGLLDGEREDFIERIDPSNKLKIDVGNLELELSEKQLEILWFYSKEKSIAERDRNQAKTVVESIEADLGRKFRDSPEVHGLGSKTVNGLYKKPTEKEITSAIYIDAGWQRAYDLFTDSQYRLSLVSNILQIMEKRESLLRHLNTRAIVALLKGRKEVPDEVIDKLQQEFTEDEVLAEKRDVVNLGKFNPSTIKSYMNRDQD